MNSKKNIKYGIALSYLLLGVSIVGTFFVTPYLLNQIGDSNYGLLSFCTSITSWIGIITSSLSGAFLYFVNKEVKENGTAERTPSLFFKIFLIISIAVFCLLSVILIICILGNISFGNYSKIENDIIRYLLFISGIQVCLTMIFNTFNQYLIYKNSFIFIRSVSILITVGVYVLNVLLAHLTKSIVAIAIISAGSTLVTGLCNTFYALKIHRLQLKNISLIENKSIAKELFNYSSIILVGAIANNLHNNIDKTVLGVMVNSTSVTLYQLSITFTTYLVSIAYVFTETLSPKFHEYYRNNDLKSVDELYLNTARIQSIILFFIVGGFVSVGQNFVNLWIGESRAVVYYYTIVLMATEIVPLCNTGGGVCTKALFKHKFCTVLNIASAVFNVIFSVILVSILPTEYAIWGCIIGTVIVRIIDSHIVTPLYYKKACNLPVGKYYLQLIKNLLFAASGIAISFVVKTFISHLNYISTIAELLITGIVFVTVYLILTYIFEKKFIMSFFKSK